jgi:glycosyltransferase involved in cell wall biosynthesis
MQLPRKIIVVNTRFLLSGKLEGIGWFTFEIIRRLVKSMPEVDFHFLFDRPYSEEFVFEKNVTPIVLGPPARHPFLWYIWFEWSVKRYLNKVDPDLFISTDGYLSLGARCPQLLVIHDLAFEHYPSFVGFLARHYYRYFTPKFAQKATAIATVSEFSKQDIIAKYNVHSDKISVVYNGANELYQPLSQDQKEKVKLKHSEGKSYFIFNGAIHPRKNLLNILLAFDLYKQDTGLDHKLIVVGRKAWQFDEILSGYEAMSYKDDVIFTGHISVEDLVGLMGTAEALVYASIFEGFGIPIIEAMKCGTPVITSNITATNEIGGDAALKADPFDVTDINNAMKSIATNSDLSQELSSKGLEWSKAFSWDRSVELFKYLVQKLV